MSTRRSSPASKLCPQNLAAFALEIRDNLVPRQQRAAHDKALHVGIRAWTEPCRWEQQADLHQVFPRLGASVSLASRGDYNNTYHFQDPRRPSCSTATSQLCPSEPLVLVFHHGEVELLLAGIGKVLRDDQYYQRRVG